MGLVVDIAQTYRAPRQVIARRASQAGSEVQAIIIVMLGCLMIFVAQWPVHARAAFLEPSIPLGARLTGAGVAWLMIMPLALYGMAAILHLILRLFGGKGSYFTARIALFWALLASAPLALLNGLTSGFIGPGIAQMSTSGLLAAGFAIFLGAGLYATEFPAKEAK
ncbi:MAG: YIP1 family protein [Paracoccaceae bacterium]